MPISVHLGRTWDEKVGIHISRLSYLYSFWVCF
jgi:hypothetical protein